MIPYILYALLLISNSKAKTPEINVEKIRATIHQMIENNIIEESLEYIAYRESRNKYDVVSPTMDYGKYQINISNLYNHEINPYLFLKDSLKQEMFARKFMKIHIDIIKNPMYNRFYYLPLTKQILINSWGGIGYAINNQQTYSHIFLPIQN
jgi:hypothetical protein